MHGWFQKLVAVPRRFQLFLFHAAWLHHPCSAGHQKQRSAATCPWGNPEHHVTSRFFHVTSRLLLEDWEKTSGYDSISCSFADPHQCLTQNAPLGIFAVRKGRRREDGAAQRHGQRFERTSGGPAQRVPWALAGIPWWRRRRRRWRIHTICLKTRENRKWKCQSRRFDQTIWGMAPNPAHLSPSNLCTSQVRQVDIDNLEVRSAILGLWLVVTCCDCLFDPSWPFFTTDYFEVFKVCVQVFRGQQSGTLITLPKNNSRFFFGKLNESSWLKDKGREST